MNKNYIAERCIFSESVVIDDVTRNGHMLGHLAKKVVHFVAGSVSRYF